MELMRSGNINVPNVLIFTEHLNATFYISFDIPLSAIYDRKEINYAVISQDFIATIDLGEMKKWAEIFKPSVVFMSRYANPFGPDILDFFRMKGVPVIYHMDDDLLHIPESLGDQIKKIHAEPSVLSSRRYLIENADLVYLSTSYLEEKLKIIFPKAKTFSGIYSAFTKTLNTVKRDFPKKVFGYMGSRGHRLDLNIALEDIRKVLESDSSIIFETFGTIGMPAELMRYGHQVRELPTCKNYYDFTKKLFELNWSVGLAPLVDNEFNRCKAPTKFLEYSAAYIPTIASNVKVYSDLITPSTGFLVENNWKDPILEVLNEPLIGDSMVNGARSLCAEKYSLRKLEEQLLFLINGEKN
jgi:glycosyltransferase involved in cell wall biosynthesis